MSNCDTNFVTFLLLFLWFSFKSLTFVVTFSFIFSYSLLSYFLDVFFKFLQSIIFIMFIPYCKNDTKLIKAHLRRIYGKC